MHVVGHPFNQIFLQIIVPPDNLGAADASLYPHYGDIFKVLKMPFRKSS